MTNYLCFDGAIAYKGVEGEQYFKSDSYKVYELLNGFKVIGWAYDRENECKITRKSEIKMRDAIR